MKFWDKLLCTSELEITLPQHYFLVERLAVDVLLDTMFFEEHIIAIAAEKRKATARDSNPVAIIAQINLPANAVLRKQGTEQVINKTSFKTGNDTEKRPILSTIV